jgi:hypothetical protein
VNVQDPLHVAAGKSVVLPFASVGPRTGLGLPLSVHDAGSDDLKKTSWL